MKNERDPEYPFIYLFRDPKNGHGYTYTPFKSNKYCEDREVYRLMWKPAYLRTGTCFRTYQKEMAKHGYLWVELDKNLLNEFPEFFKEIITGISGNY